MKRIAYTLPDGRLHVVHPAPLARLVRAAEIRGKLHLFEPPQAADAVFRFSGGEVPIKEWAETEEVFVERILAKDVPAEATQVILINAADLPDRKDRERWTIADGKVVVR